MNTIKIKHSIFIVLAGLALSSCAKTESADQQREDETQKIASYVQSQGYNVQPSVSGLYYIPVTEGTGDTPNDSDFVLIKYKARTLDNKLFDSTDSTDILDLSTNLIPFFSQRLPLKFYMKVGYFPGLKEALLKMKTGGKSIAIMPSILSLTKNDFIPKKYEIELVKVIHDMAAFEQQKINDFVTTLENKDSIFTSGLHYIEKIPGSGDKPTTGKIASVTYSLKLIDGKVFQKTADGYYFNFVVGIGQVIKGFDEAVMNMKKGGKATVIIPYSLGYGSYAQFNDYNQLVIPWYSTLVYELQLVNIQ